MKQKPIPARTWTTGMFPQSTGKKSESKDPSDVMMRHKKALDEAEAKRERKKVEDELSFWFD